MSWWMWNSIAKQRNPMNRCKCDNCNPINHKIQIMITIWWAKNLEKSFMILLRRLRPINNRIRSIAIEMRSHQNRKWEMPRKRKLIHPPNIYERNGHFSRLSGGDKWTWKIPAQIFNQVDVCVRFREWRSIKSAFLQYHGSSLNWRYHVEAMLRVTRPHQATRWNSIENSHVTCYREIKKKNLFFSRLSRKRSLLCTKNGTVLHFAGLIVVVIRGNALSRSRKLSAMCKWHKHGP